VASPPDWADVRAIVAPFLDGAVEAGTFFRVRVRGLERASVLDTLVLLVRRFALRRQTRLGVFTYVAVHADDVGLFELRWSPLRVHRVIALRTREELAPRRTDANCISVTLDGREVELEAAAPGIDATELIERLTER
jgi:hypothetical protein